MNASDLMTTTEAALHLGVNPKSVRHVLRRYGIREERGYPRERVMALKRKPRGRSRRDEND